MDSTVFKQKKLFLLVLLLVLLPILFYSIYEISSLNEYEKIIEEVYQHQMNLMLYSINKSAWDICNDWVTKLSQLLGDGEAEDSEERLAAFLNENVVIRIVITADTLLRKKTVVSHLRQQREDEFVTEIIREVQNNKQVISKLYSRLMINYRKLESLNIIDVNYPEYSDYTILLDLIDKENPQLLVLAISGKDFLDYFLRQIILDVAQDEFAVGIFRKGENKPLISTDSLAVTGEFVTKRLWILQDHFIAIALKSSSIQNMAADRFKRSLVLISILGLMLIIGAVFLYRNIKNEMEIARLKSEFVSNVSHELRTPLSIIRMFAETIELNRLDSDNERIEFCKIIGRESERLTHIIENFLDISRLEAGQREYKFEKINLNDVVQNILNLYQFHIKNRGFELVDKLADQNLWISADKEAVAEVLINLLDNSMKYFESERYISIRTYSENKHIVLEVEDNGIGIPEGELKSIFTKFYRIRGTKGIKEKGTGLGLTLVKNIVDAHKGKIEVTSTLNKGSCFRIIFNTL